MLPSTEVLPLSPAQIELLETALRQLTKIPRSGWETIPEAQRRYFAQYMEKEVWAGGVDLMTVRDAALRLIRDAVARTGAFSAGTLVFRAGHGPDAGS